MGKSALHWVASTPLPGYGQPMECAMFLIEKKANIEQEDSVVTSANEKSMFVMFVIGEKHNSKQQQN